MLSRLFNGKKNRFIAKLLILAPVVTAADSVYVFKRNEELLEMNDGGVLMRFGRAADTAQVNQTGAAAFDNVTDGQTAQQNGSAETNAGGDDISASRNDKPQKPVWTETTIAGDTNFAKKTQKAMDLIKKSPFGYELTTGHIAVIELNTFSGMRAFDNPPTYQVGEATYNASTT